MDRNRIQIFAKKTKNEFKIALNMRRLAWLADIERMRTSEDSKAFDRLSCVISSVLWHHRKKKSLIWTNSSRAINRYHHLWLFDYRLFHFIDSNDFIFRNSRNNLFIFQKSYRIGPESTSTGFSMRSRENIHTISFNRSTWSRSCGERKKFIHKSSSLSQPTSWTLSPDENSMFLQSGHGKIKSRTQFIWGTAIPSGSVKVNWVQTIQKKRSSVHVRREQNRSLNETRSNQARNPSRSHCRREEEKEQTNRKFINSLTLSLN